MAEFPRLKTNAVTQYPATKSIEHSTRVVRFLDGSEQRFREYAAPLRRWVIQLELLDESEAAGIAEFFTSIQGSFGRFSFTDPWSGAEYADCSLESGELKVEASGTDRAKTVLIVRENRN